MIKKRRIIVIECTHTYAMTKGDKNVREFPEKKIGDSIALKKT